VIVASERAVRCRVAEPVGTRDGAGSGGYRGCVCTQVEVEGGAEGVDARASGIAGGPVRGSLSAGRHDGEKDHERGNQSAERGLFYSAVLFGPPAPPLHDALKASARPTLPQLARERDI
jgi:hypothetical protein